MKRLLVVFSLVFFQITSAQAEQSEATARFLRGVELYESGDHAAALAEFTVAYSQRPHFAILYNIAQCHVALGRYDDAIENFERFLSEGGRRVSPQERANAQRELERLGSLIAYVTVEVNIDGATILVDGREVGLSPMSERISVLAGLRVIEARLEGYRTARREITIAGGASHPTVEFNLEATRRTRRLTVLSTAVGGRVFIDEEERGTLPWEGEVLAGRHVLEVRAEGYEPGRQVVVITPEGEHSETMDLDFIGQPARLRVDADAEAVVYVGDQRIGETPLRRFLLPAGRHTLRVEAEGYLPWRGELDVDEGDRVAASIELLTSDDGGVSPAVFWSMIGLMAVSGITAGALGGVALSQERELQTFLDDLAEDQASGTRSDQAVQYRELTDQGRALALSSDILWGATGAFALTALILAFHTRFRPPQSEGEIEIGAGYDGERAWLSATGRF